ncbi:hypothetical protein C8R41DRAFT_924986 [Lentinula lateritia]|uniref:G-protein coupled receptors family 1 profile domain-containing protein n=1 Tax=Lentinula lateritia TaxID=40482 RepID=A0ABQ8V1R0_9AGAR|nr:hypothetical protein C8R41DRAFT_924986 [Lentinula lateritia]
MSRYALAMREAEETHAFVVFDVLQFTALALVSATYLSALFSTKLQRLKTWFALMISSLMYCISFLLLLGHQTGASPSLGLCLFQAGLIYAAPPSVAAAGLAFIVELYLRLFTTLTSRKLDKRLITALLFLPPLTHQFVFWIALFTGISKQHTVQRNTQQMFCHINDNLPTTVTGVTVVALLVLMILLECTQIVPVDFQLSCNMFQQYTQSIIFGVYAVSSGIYGGVANVAPFFHLHCSFGRELTHLLEGWESFWSTFFLNTSSAASSGTGTQDLLAIIPLSIALVFGTQEDIVQMYKFWKKRGLPAGSPQPNIDSESQGFL